MRFLIIRHARLDGVFLSKPGHWGNLPFPDDDAATAEAQRLAGAGKPFTIERETIRARAIPG